MGAGVRDEELVEGVDGGRQDAEPVGADGVGELLDAHAGDDLIVAGDLQELLVEDVVLVAVDEGGDVADYCEDVELVAFDGVVGEEDVVEFEVEEVVAHGAHHLVGLHVVHVEDVEVDKRFRSKNGRLDWLPSATHLLEDFADV